MIGEPNRNPIFDSRVYEVDFEDGNYYDYSASVILEKLYDQVDDYGRSTSTLADIVDHRTNESAVSKENGWYEMKGSKARKRVITIKGWEFQIEWIDGTRTWVPLLDLKESNPVELTEYLKSRKIDDKSALAWWVNWTLKRREKIPCQDL